MSKINNDKIAESNVKPVGRPRKEGNVTPSPTTPSLGWDNLGASVVEAKNGAFAALFSYNEGIDWVGAEIDEEQLVTQFTGQEGSNFKHKYVRWGADNLMPMYVSQKIGADETAASSLNTLKNICYGGGVSFTCNDDTEEHKTEHDAARADAEDFFWSNDVSMLTLQQAKNIKTFAWDLTVIVLSRDGKRITDIYSRDVEEVRLHPHMLVDVMYGDDLLRRGTIPFAYYGKFNCNCAGSIKNVEVIRLLDERNPLRDLQVKMGAERDPRTGELHPIKERKFGILRRMPTVEKRFYPIPPYAGVLKGHWYDIKKQIELSLLAKIKNTAQIRYLVQIHPQFWVKKAEEEGVVEGPSSAKGKELINRVKKEILDYLCGSTNDSKPWLTTSAKNPVSGEIEDMIKITTVDTKTQGGDWSEDISESCNMMCYGFGVHPSLVGAVPGKSSTNNSGSDKRELHTIAQAAESSSRNVMMMSYYVVLRYNGWWEQGVRASIPFMQLTTLDEHVSAKEVQLTGNS